MQRKWPGKGNDYSVCSYKAATWGEFQYYSVSYPICELLLIIIRILHRIATNTFVERPHEGVSYYTQERLPGRAALGAVDIAMQLDDGSYLFGLVVFQDTGSEPYDSLFRNMQRALFDIFSNVQYLQIFDKRL